MGECGGREVAGKREERLSEGVRRDGRRRGGKAPPQRREKAGRAVSLPKVALIPTEQNGAERGAEVPARHLKTAEMP